MFLRGGREGRLSFCRKLHQLVCRNAQVGGHREAEALRSKALKNKIRCLFLSLHLNEIYTLQ